MYLKKMFVEKGFLIGYESPNISSSQGLYGGARSTGFDSRRTHPFCVNFKINLRKSVRIKF